MKTSTRWLIFGLIALSWITLQGCQIGVVEKEVDVSYKTTTHSAACLVLKWAPQASASCEEGERIVVDIVNMNNMRRVRKALICNAGTIEVTGLPTGRYQFRFRLQQSIEGGLARTLVDFQRTIRLPEKQLTTIQVAP